MFKSLPIIVLASSAAANFTTSFFQPNIFLETMSVGYFGSIIGVNGDKTTVGIRVDDDADPQHFATGEGDTITIASTLWEAYTADIRNPFGRGSTASDASAYGYNLACTKETTIGANLTCDISRGPSAARSQACPTIRTRSAFPARTTELVYTFPANISGSTVIQTTTVTTTIGGPVSSIERPWCSGDSSLPQSLVESSIIFPPYNVASYKLVITAGEEKLNATTGAGVGSSTVQITGSGSGGSPTSPSSTGLAAPMRSAAPALAGLGAAVAAYFL